MSIVEDINEASIPR